MRDTPAASTETERARNGNARRLLLFLALVLLAAAAQAQTANSGMQQATAVPLFKYYIWGEVRSPGLFNLGANLDLIELMSTAGGPTEAADLSRVVLVQGVSQRRTTLDLRKSLGSGNPVYLSPGDIVIVPKSLRYAVRDEIVFYSTLLTAIDVFVTIISLVRATK